MLTDCDKVTFFSPVSHITAVVTSQAGWKAAGRDGVRQAVVDTG